MNQYGIQVSTLKPGDIISYYYSPCGCHRYLSHKFELVELLQNGKLLVQKISSPLSESKSSAPIMITTDMVCGIHVPSV